MVTVYFRINTGKTLGKLHWKSNTPLQSNGMDAIPKTKLLPCVSLNFFTNARFFAYNLGTVGI